MTTIIDIESFPPASMAGPPVRKPKNGPEQDLVHLFVRNQFPAPPKGQSLTVFIEPKVGLTFPDIVAVYWNEKTTERWPLPRKNLSKQDILLLHYIYMSKGASIEDLEAVFPRTALSSIEQLSKSRLIYSKMHSWHTYALKHIFAVRRLITIEAKIDDWKGGLQQAFHNTWFSSESYLLMPNSTLNKNLISSASSLGIGLLASHYPLTKPILIPRYDHLPKSYISWFFNEWAWRCKFYSPQE
jgi:hypothetical protein